MKLLGKCIKEEQLEWKKCWKKKSLKHSNCTILPIEKALKLYVHIKKKNNSNELKTPETQQQIYHDPLYRNAVCLHPTTHKLYIFFYCYNFFCFHFLYFSSVKSLPSLRLLYLHLHTHLRCCRLIQICIARMNWGKFMGFFCAGLIWHYFKSAPKYNPWRVSVIECFK